MTLERLYKILGFVTCILALLGLIFIGVKSTLASGEVKYCYIEYNSAERIPHYTVQGFREWRVDSTIGYYTTYDQAISMVNSIGCHLGIKK